MAARVVSKLPEKLLPVKINPAAQSAQESSVMQPRDSLVANFIGSSSLSKIVAQQGDVDPILAARQVVVERDDTVLIAAYGIAGRQAVGADAFFGVVHLAILQEKHAGDPRPR